MAFVDLFSDPTRAYTPCGSCLIETLPRADVSGVCRVLELNTKRTRARRANMRNGYRVIDTDCHQMEPPTMWADYIDAPFADRAPRIGEIAHGKKGMCVEGEALTKQHGSYPMDSPEFIAAAARAMKRFEKTRSAGFSPASRIDDMDAQGVDAQVIYPT